MRELAALDACEEPLDERLQGLVAALPHGFLLARGENVVWANDRLVEASGRRAALGGVALAELFEDTGGGVPGSGSRSADVLECGMRRPGGDLRSVLCRCAWREDAAQPGGWVVEDITHVRKLESELIHAGQDLSKLHRELASLREALRSERAEREEILAVVSHELRTPVTIISGYSRLLLSGEAGPVNDEQRHFLEESGKGCHRLDRFISNLLDASRVSKGDDVLEISAASLVPVIDGVAAMFQPMFEEKQLHLELEADRDACHARFDRTRVEQVLTNLVGNAIRYAPPGGHIEIRAHRIEGPSGPRGRRFVEIAVADDGPGIDAKDRERIFRPYVQAGEESRAGGLGLGLAICKRLVKAHGGAIGVGERAGGGSRFFFTLPVDEAPAPEGAGVEGA